jgi:hypothetical protein
MAQPALNWDQMVYLAVMPETEPNPAQDEPLPAKPEATRDAAPPQAEPALNLRAEEDLLDLQENLARPTSQSRLHDLLLVGLYVIATAILVAAIVWLVRGRLW